MDPPLAYDSEPAQRPRRPPRPTSSADASISISTISADVPPMPSPSEVVSAQSCSAVASTARAEVHPIHLLLRLQVPLYLQRLPPCPWKRGQSAGSPSRPHCSTSFSGCWRRGCRLYLAPGRTRCCRYFCGLFELPTCYRGPRRYCPGAHRSGLERRICRGELRAITPSAPRGGEGSCGHEESLCTFEKVSSCKHHLKRAGPGAS